MTEQEFLLYKNKFWKKLTTELFLNQHVYTVIRLYGIKNGLCDNIDMLLPVVTIIFS